MSLDNLRYTPPLAKSRQLKAEYIYSQGHAKRLVCEMPYKCDCGSAESAVTLQREKFTLRSQASPRQFEQARLHSARTDIALDN